MPVDFTAKPIGFCFRHAEVRILPPQPVSSWKHLIILAPPDVLFRDIPNASAALIPKTCSVRINGSGVALPG
jgi:hypothetical protein